MIKLKQWNRNYHNCKNWLKNRKKQSPKRMKNFYPSNNDNNNNNNNDDDDKKKNFQLQPLIQITTTALIQKSVDCHQMNQMNLKRPKILPFTSSANTSIN